MTFSNLANIRALFPAASAMTYLDSGFQTPMCRPVKDRLEAFIRSSYETAGPKADWLAEVEQVRARLAGLINAAADEIAFCKNTSEAMNIAAQALPLKPGDKVLMLEGDHPNNAYAFMNLARKGVATRFVPMSHRVDASTFQSYIDPTVKVISMSLVTFHAGHLFDVANVGQLCAKHDIHLVVDVMQGIGVTPVDVRAIGATFVGSGTHKGLLVPQGLGFLWWNRERLPDAMPAYMAAASLENPPADFIARHQNTALASTARRFEMGNFNIPAILALGAGLELIESLGVPVIAAHCYALGDRLIAGLDAAGVELVGPRDPLIRSPHIYVVRLDPDVWLPRFSSSNIRLSPERDGLRISLGMFNNTDDIDAFLAVLLEHPAAVA